MGRDRPSGPRQQLERLRAERWTTAAEQATPVYQFVSVRRAKGFIPVLATGGIGDLFMAFLLVNSLSRATGRQRIRLYSPFPDVARFILDHWTGSADVDVDPEPFPGYDFFIQVNSIAQVRFQKNFRSFWLPEMEQIYLRYSGFANSEPWQNLIRFHPQLDGEVARVAVEKGYTRWTLPHAMLGLQAPTPMSKYSLSIGSLPYDWEPYITVHDGFDGSQPVQHRSTKTWNIRHWARLVQEFKAKYPRFMVVQIGGDTSRRIPGVDIDLVGRCPVEESLAILSRSSLHVDGDSGLVHAARHMQVRSVVLFGPTPVDFFGYPENVNLTAGPCGPCFWLRKDWMQQCCLKNDRPQCMDDISPERVLGAISGVLG